MKYTVENLKRWIIYLWIRFKEITFNYSYNYRKNITTNDSIFLISSLIPYNIYEKDGVKIINNKWGEGKLKRNESYHQVIYYKSGQKKTGWQYITQKSNRGVIGYPEILIGQSPWGGETTNECFPIKIKDIGVLESSYNVTMHIQPKMYNLTYDLWFTKNMEISSNNISHELMIWEDRNLSKAGGKYITTVKLVSGVYDLYHKYKELGADGVGGWKYTAFVRKDRRRKGGININEFIQEMLNRNYITADEILTGVEFGNEIVNASGVTIVNNYNVTLVNNKLK